MTKNEVLNLLLNTNDYISGEKMSAQLGVSRTAINVAVKALRAEGYEIESSTNKGYILRKSPDALTERALMEYLPLDRLKKVICLETVDSTNKYLRDLAFNGAPDRQIVIANEQTAGRGRLGRSFVSLKDTGLYISMLFRPDSLPSDTVSITAWTAVAISNAIETVCGIRADIKWVNDLVLNRKKICGILTEMSIESESGGIQHLIIGIGVNINQNLTDFPEEIRDIASSIKLELGSEVKRSQLTAEIIKELDKMCDAWPNGKADYLEKYKAHSCTLNQDIYIISRDGERTGRAIDINEDFSLKVQFTDGEIQDLSSGEVSVRGLYNYV
jgi:BirA family biotin operon repressor/biotin-[acetyl-CoA-carboxylase] ligase